ncbi:MAG: hypothetical protein LBQ75_08420 [Zoogloeaceae bacterium]|jgi:hypothetical protein|nr:hypothetical protein [Zoogloeaceae bacterium]
MMPAKSTEIQTLTAISILFFILGSASFFALTKSFGFASYITSASWFAGLGCAFYFVYRLSSLNSAIMALVATFFFLALSLIASNLLFDVFWDGISYHQGAIMALTENFDFLHSTLGGSNPVDNELWAEVLPYNNVLWMNSYPKLSWLYAAPIYELTGNIHYGKSINFLLLFSLGFSAWSALSDLPKVMRWLATVALTFNPIVVTQLFTHYVDGALGAFLIISIIGLYGFFWVRRSMDFWILAIAGMIGCASLKFTGFVFSSCIAVATFYLVFKTRSNSTQPNLSSAARLAIYIPILIIGVVLMVNPYVKNMVEGNHIFHPTMGENKVNMMGGINLTQKYHEKNRFSKLVKSVFGKSENTFKPSGLKIPFKFSKRKLKRAVKNFYWPDVRWGGWGPLFGEVFLVTLVCLLMRYSKIKEYAPLVFLLAVLSIINPESWWARYNPQLHTFVAVSLLILYIKDQKSRWVANTMFAILIVNSFLLLGAHFKGTLQQNRRIETVINEISNNGFYPVCQNVKNENLNHSWNVRIFHLEPILDRLGVTLKSRENCDNDTQICVEVIYGKKVCRLTI